MNNQHNQHIGVLDGLRALAILLVLLAHSIYFIQLYNVHRVIVFGSQHITWFLMNGWTGVNLFFVLSGFLITRQLLEVFAVTGRSRHIRLFGYARKRLFRIIPAYYLIATASLIFMLPGMGFVEWLWRFVCYLLFLQDYFQQTVLPQFWSLAVEIQFYLLAPAMVYTLSRLRPGLRYLSFTLLMTVLLVVKVFVAWFSPPDDGQTMFFTTILTPLHMSMDSLVAGMAACYLWHDPRLRIVITTPFWSNALFGSGLCLFIALTAFVTPHFLFYQRPPPFFDETGYFSLIALAFGSMMLGLLGGSVASPLFAARPLRFIAMISYSLYLVHILLVPYAIQLAQKVVPDPHDLTLLWLVEFPIFMALIVSPAAVMYYFIERPFNEWARKVRAES
jgi:peptidoglycan/LPS O-acetylase OafA/YrhL